MELVKKNFVFGPNELELEEQHVARFHVFVPDNIKFEELLKPEIGRASCRERV